MASEASPELAAAIKAFAEAAAKEHWSEAALQVIALGQAAATSGVEGPSTEEAARFAVSALHLMGAEIGSASDVEAASRLAVIAYFAGFASANLTPDHAMIAKSFAGLQKGNTTKAAKKQKWQAALEEWLASADLNESNAALAHKFRSDRAPLKPPAGNGLDKAIAVYRLNRAE